jgi:hypothetical protein
MALAGPVTIRRLEPNSAATMHGSSAAYRPYWGGTPAKVAKATPCGSTTTAPVRPASASARSAPGWRHSSRHCMTGRCIGRCIGRLRAAFKYRDRRREIARNPGLDF